MSSTPSSESGPLYQYAESVTIAAPPAVVWELVTAMDRYGEWSSENTGGYWRKGANGEPGTGVVGDEFVGINRRDGVEWKALVEIVERQEQRSFAFITGGSAGNYVHWRYQLEPDGDGTRLSEQWELRNLSPIMIEHGQAEVDKRVSNAKESIGVTLTRMKAAAEATR
ncbi:MAG: SRPBCC family protein [Acidimicrobiales bacterium]